YWHVRTTTGCGTGPFSAARSFTTQAPAAGCPLGGWAKVRSGESFGGGAPGWMPSGTGDPWAESTLRSHDGTRSYRAIDVASISDQRLVSPAITLPASGQAPVTLQFWNWQDLENEAPKPEPGGGRGGG